MEERTIKVNKDTAISWYRSDNTILKTLALQAFNKEELEMPSIPEMIRAILNSGEYDITATQRIQIQALGGRNVLVISAPKLLRVIALYFNKEWKKKEYGTGYFFYKKDTYSHNYSDKWLGKDGWAIMKHDSVVYPSIAYFKNEKDCRKAFDILKELNKLDNLYTDL